MGRTLYVIGNGFDIAHSLPTKYNNFKEWLEDKSYIQKNPQDYHIFVFLIENIFQFARENGKLIDLWSDFERALGCLDIRAYFKHLRKRYADQDVFPQASMTYTDTYYFLSDEVMKQMPYIFAEWIRGVVIYNDVERVYDDLENQSIFLTFNYTDTLEDVYGVPDENILHIHGRAKDINSPIIVGHSKQYDETKCCEIFKEVFKQEDDGTSYVLTAAMNSAQKDVNGIIATHQKWFEELEVKGIYQIILIGLSFGEVDDLYFKEIAKRLPSTQWKFVLYAPNEYEKTNSVNRVNDFIKRIGINKKLCSAIASDDNRLIAL